MRIQTYKLPPIGTNAFLLSNPDNGRAVLVDAPGNAWNTVAPVLKKEGLSLEALILTHGHWDHMLDGARFNEEGIPVWAHEADREWIENPQMQSPFMLPGLDVRPISISRFLGQGEVLDLMGYPAEVRHVPGHAPGNILIYFPEQKVAFVGDVIFAGSVGRYDLPGADGATLARSIREQIYTLPDDTTLYPGHGPETTVGWERCHNPYVRSV